jgi:hypothetical protein
LNHALTSSPWLIFAVIAVLIAASFLVQRYFGQKRAEALKGVALQMGLTYEGDDWLVSSRAPQLEVPLFDDHGGGQTRNIISGERDGLRCSFFDYIYPAGRSSVAQTLATFTQEIWLPQFAIAPQDILHKLGDAMLHKAIHFDSDPEFSKRFRLVSVDPDKVRELFTPGMLSFFESFPVDAKWHVQGSGSTLLIYRPGSKVSAPDYNGFVENTTRIARSFFSFSGLKKPAS